MKEISKDTLDVLKDGGDNIKLVDFYADWCSACVSLMPHIVKMSENEYYKNVEFYKANVEDVGEFAKSQGVRGLPCLIAYKDGEILKVLRGNKPISDVIEFVESLK